MTFCGLPSLVHVLFNVVQCSPLSCLIIVHWCYMFSLSLCMLLLNGVMCFPLACGFSMGRSFFSSNVCVVTWWCPPCPLLFIVWWCTMPSHPLCMLLDGILPSFACAFILSYVHLVRPFACVVATHNMFYVLSLFLLNYFVLWALPLYIVLLVFLFYLVCAH